LPRLARLRRDAGLLPVVLTVLLCAPAVTAEEIKDPAAECEKVCPERPCERITFRGFSPDSKQFGHALLQCPGPHGDKAAARIVYHAATLGEKGRKLPSTPIPKNGEVFPVFYGRHDYQVEEVAGTSADGVWTFDTGNGVTLTFYWRTEKKVAWYVEVRRKGQLKYTYRREFDEIYYAVLPRLYVSPDRKKAALVLSLDAMIKEDAGIGVFRLRPE
jgi:hypothetical protein